MALYSYKAIDAAGKTAKGLQDAANLIDLEQRLKRGGLDLISAKEEADKISFGGNKIKRIHLITFFFNLEQLVRAGVPLLECLADLRDTMEEPVFREIIASMIESIENGKKLSQSMAEHPNAFDNITVSLTRAGEESGRMVEVFKHLTESLKWQDEMASQTKTMMIYPAIVGTLVLGITFYLMVSLVPQLVNFIKSMGQDVPFYTQALIATSNFFVAYWGLMLLVPPLLFGVYKTGVSSSPAFAYWVDDLKLRIWPTGPILRKIILARFANTFAMMYSSGISILDCIANTRNLVDNHVISQNLQQVMQEIEAGKNLTQSFQNTGIFPPLVVRMLKVGESTGQLDQALLNVSYFYDRDVKEAIKRMQTMIEPTMTVVLGLLLGWVMVSVLLPIYDLISKVKI